jgi:FkbM family methyltransferase
MRLGSVFRAFFEKKRAKIKRHIQNKYLRLNVYVGDKTLLSRTNYGALVYLDSMDISLTRHMIDSGSWEPWLAQFFKRELLEGDHFIDIGANCGYFTLLAAQRVGTSGAVVAFEPQEKLAKLLKKSISINGFSDFAIVMQNAIGELDSTALLGKISHDRGTSSLMVGFGDGVEPSETVKVLPLTSAIQNSATALDKAIAPTVMKIDVEGYEYFVWRGMQDIVKQNNLRLIVLEFAPDRYISQGQDPYLFISEIKSAGYKISVLVHNGVEIDFDDNAVKNIFDKEGQVDLVLRKLS